jgi:hypothetical protein
VDPRRVPYDYPEPYPRVLITLDGQQWPGVLRRRTWDADAGAWRGSVDACVDGHRVSRQVGQGQVELLPSVDE